MRGPIVLFSLTVFLLVGIAMSGPVEAAAKLLKNDQFPNDGTFNCDTHIQVNDELEARFTVAPADVPFDVPYRLESIEILYCGGGTASVGWDIWQDTGATIKGQPIATSGNTFYPLLFSGQLNTIDLSKRNIVINYPSIRVGIFHQSSTSPTFGFGVDTAIQPGKNFVKLAPNYLAQPAEQRGVTGDWIMRLYITTADQTATPTQTGTVILSPTRTPTVTSTVTPNTQGLDGHVTTQRLPTPTLQVVQLNVAFYPPQAGAPLGVTPVATYVVTTGPDGNFRITNTLQGTYDIRVKQAQAISVEKENVVVPSTGFVFVEFGTLLSGDADQNDGVSAADFTVLKQTFTQSTICAIQIPVPNPCADFDANGTVGPNDFSLLKQNFGKIGPQFAA
jgi:hypothetical protein